jgi:PAS domain S-box-containing protein
MIIIYNTNSNDLLKEHIELSKNVAKEISVGMEQHLLEKVKTTRTIAVTPLLLESLKKSNEHYSSLSEQIRDKEIQSKNEKWKSIKNIDNPFVLKYTNNEVSKYLKNQQNNLEGEYGEIFITNKHGALLASTAKLTTFYHGQKYWWKKAYNNGEGAVFFDDRGYDESVGNYVLGIVVPIKNDNEIVGILKVNLNILGSIGEMILNSTREKTEIIKLVRSGGLIVFNEGKEPLSERVSEKLLDKINSGESAVVLEENGEEWIVGISEIGITSGLNNFQFGGNFESIDHKKGNSGETWYILDIHPISHITEPARESLKGLLIIGFLLSVFLAFTSMLIGRRAAKPIKILIEQAKRIAKGDFDSRVSINRNDEIGFLGESFNSMAESLKETTISIDKLSNEIIERGKVEEALRDSERKYKSLFSNMLDGFAFHQIILDENNVPIDYTFLEINEAFENQTGLKSEKIIGKKVTEVLSGIENDPTRWIDIYGNVALTGEAIRFENFSKPINKWYSVIAYSTLKGYFATIFEDITERKLAEKEILERNDEQKKLFEKSEKQRVANLVVLNDLNKITKDLKAEITERKRSEQIQKVLYNISNAVSTTDNLIELIGFVQRELGAIIDTKNFYVALYDDKKDMIELPFLADEKDSFTSFPAGKTLTKYVIETKKPLLANIALKEKFAKEGKLEYQGSLSKIWLGVPLKIDGKVTGVFAVQSYTDEFAYDESDMELLEFIGHQISTSIDRKKAEEELIHAKEKAEENDRLKTSFLLNMSHEIRTPMNGIMGFAKLIQNKNITPEKLNHFTNIIVESSNQLLHVVDDILDISRIETGQVYLFEEEISVNKILSETFSLFEFKAKEKNLKLKVSKELSDIESAIITDQSKFKQILFNLLVNAFKFTDTGSINFGYKLKEKYLEFFVKDSGIGIPKKYHKDIFDRFHKIEKHSDKIYEGTGLGLAICTGLVEKMKGRIWLESEENKGASFYFTIPYKTVDQTKVSNIKGNDFGGNLDGFTILIVEDEESNSEYIEEVLLQYKIVQLYAKDGKQAVQMFKENPNIDLVLMDIKLPKMNGFEATKRIKEINPNIPIIAQTAYAMLGDKEKALEAGCNDYISKPIIEEKLIDLLEKYLNK